jgi:hypothetical protein
MRDRVEATSSRQEQDRSASAQIVVPPGRLWREWMSPSNPIRGAD